MSSKIVSTDADDELLIKGVVFPTRDEARDWLSSLRKRQLVSREAYVEHTDDRPTHTYLGGTLGTAS